ncbi:MAG: hypothetical protein GEV11_22825 [Streptosporangiales bacterium]|nr:hypothetical protein [Streptosporangiales bacterium]
MTFLSAAVLLGLDADVRERQWAIALDGKDLCESWDDTGRPVLFSAMTHRRDGRTGVTLGQIAVPGGTNETTQVHTLLDPLDIQGALVTADAAQTYGDTARYLMEDKNADCQTPGFVESWSAGFQGCGDRVGQDV